MGAPTPKPAAIERRRLAIGKTVKKARIAKGISLPEAAAKVRTSMYTFRRWEAGTHSVPAELLPEIADLLEVSVESLCGSSDSRRSAA